MNRFRFSKKEKTDLLKAWFAISLAFAIVLRGQFEFIYTFIISASTVGMGFLFHELAHKFLAQKYGCIAEFRSYDNMLILAVLMSFFGFIIAAPGGVMIQGYIDNIRNGRISAAGITANLSIAFIFLLLALATPMAGIAMYGFMINSWLALFNLIPFGNFDGTKVLAWNKMVYFSMVSIAVVFMLIQGFI
ncbi:hypothetical protein GF336_07665 [Candidatus Woesearchaeota archaeon]|nr:hypothetical protein [Candidatus Woesearchaeota archaeon]